MSKTEGGGNEEKIASIALLCGLPASGKSTLASSMLQNFQYINNQCNTLSHETGRSDDTYETNPLFDKVVLIDYDSITREEMDKIKLKETLLTNTQTNEHAIDPKEYQGMEMNQKEKAEEDTQFPSFKELERIAWKKSRKTALEILERSLENHFLSHLNNRSNRPISSDKTKPSKINRLLIILDDNFHLRSMRREVYKKCQKYVVSQSDSTTRDACFDSNETITTHILKQNKAYCSANRISFTTIVINVPMEECLQRNQLRKGSARVPDHIITKMANSIELPSIHKNKNERDQPDNHLKTLHYRNNWEDDSCVCVLSNASYDKEVEAISSKFQFQDISMNQNSNTNEQFRTKLKVSPILTIIIETIQKNLENNLISPPLTKEEEELVHQQLLAERAKTMKNIHHTMDQLLRQFVGVTCRAKKAWAKQANMARREIMDNVRTSPNNYENSHSISNDETFLNAMEGVWQNYVTLIQTHNEETNELNRTMMEELKLKLKNVYETFTSRQRS